MQAPRLAKILSVGKNYEIWTKMYSLALTGTKGAKGKKGTKRTKGMKRTMETKGTKEIKGTKISLYPLQF